MISDFHYRTAFSVDMPEYVTTRLLSDFRAHSCFLVVQVSKASMETLTLARFILETSLMDYELLDVKDSLMAASALMLAFQMQNVNDWSPTLNYYSNFTKDDLRDTTHRLLSMLNKLQGKNLKTIRNKYSHK